MSFAKRDTSSSTSERPVAPGASGAARASGAAGGASTAGASGAARSSNAAKPPGTGPTPPHAYPWSAASGFSGSAGTGRTGHSGGHGGADAGGSQNSGEPGRSGRSESTTSRTRQRTASIARSIALSGAGHLLLDYLMLDLLLIVTLLATFVFQSYSQLPDTLADAPVLGVSSSGITSTINFSQNAPFDLSQVKYVVTESNGETHEYALASILPYVTPAFIVMLVYEVLSLLNSLSRTRSIRRKLKPLNDLALTAEAIGSATDLSKIDSLERAISSADVDSPKVETGDADLRSIEIALNSLLRRMQDAKLQQMRFVSDASHELRTPIAVIQGYVEMLDRWGKTDEAVLDESIEALKDESAHMKELVEQLLFLARGDSGRNTLMREPLNLAKIAREVWEESSMIDHNHTYLIKNTPEDEEDPRFGMVGDVAMIKQSMRIIVQNATKYSPAGSSITITAEPAGWTPRDASVNADGGTGGAGGAGGKPEVSYSVQDEGIGMSEQDVKHVFERFWRSDAARGGESGGSGLGLSIAKWIVDAHDGEIRVLSYPGVGTRFTASFPAESPAK